jgi:hypothetical protein
MRKLLIFFMILALALMGAGVVNASTSANKQAAIDAGLAYLAGDQQGNGSWINGSEYAQADTGAALLAFTEQYYKPLGWDGKNYLPAVQNAVSYLLGQATTLSLSPANWWGFNGTGGSGVGLQWTNTNEETYGSGLVIAGLIGLVNNPSGGAPLVNPSTVITSSVTSNAAVLGLTYGQVIQKALDSWTWGQSPPSTGNRYGGWRYFTAQNDSDMSTTQWPLVNYLLAKGIPGVVIPGTGSQTAAGVNAFVTACQYPNAAYPSGWPVGSVDYQPGANILSLTHIGGLLLANAFTGGGAGNIANALAYLNAHWTDTANGTWYGNFGNPYAMFALYKGLESQYGTTGAGPITNLNPETTPIDPGATWNWWEDMCQWLCQNQNADGSWSGYQYWYGDLATAWDINILNATAFAPPSVPLPPSVLLLGSGLLGLLGWRRFKKS